RENGCSICGSDRPEIVAPPPKPKPPVDVRRRRRRFLFIAGSFAAGIVFCIAYFWLIPFIRYAINASKPALVVSAEELVKLMRENPKEAESSYAPGTPVILTGTVIGEAGFNMPGHSGPYDVTLRGNDDEPGELPWIICRAREDQKPAFGA